MANKPLIGVTVGAMTSPTMEKLPHGRLFLERKYVERLRAAGAEVIMIPPGADPDVILPLLDGWLIPGGDDFDSALWNEPLHPTASLETADRPELEFKMWAQRDPELPVFGICYGCQFINVAQGGSLIQHLPDVVGNDDHRGYPMQDFNVQPTSKLGQIVGSDAQGRSSHHQAVKQPGKGVAITAHHQDGTVEAIEIPDLPFVVGVQWHPERSDVETTTKLFEAFVDAARKFKAAKTLKEPVTS